MLGPIDEYNFLHLFIQKEDGGEYVVDLASSIHIGSPLTILLSNERRVLIGTKEHAQASIRLLLSFLDRYAHVGLARDPRSSSDEEEGSGRCAVFVQVLPAWMEIRLEHRDVEHPEGSAALWKFSVDMPTTLGEVCDVLDTKISRS